MNAIPFAERRRLGDLLKTNSQEQVMSQIPQFQEADIHSASTPTPPSKDDINALVFNMERGTYCHAIIDFLKNCPAIQPFDLIFANELDDGCTRSGGRDVAQEISNALGMHYVFGLEFIELTQQNAEKAFHGNALFSRYPIEWAKVFHLPEAYNWYHHAQQRIGSRCAIFARLNVAGTSLGVVCIHLENRTDGEGRLLQMQAIYQEALRVFPHIPILLGGDLNTNAFDGRDQHIIDTLAEDLSLLQERINHLETYEPLLSAAEDYGFEYKESFCPGATRRKPVPNRCTLPLHLDWFLSRGLAPLQTRNVSTVKEACSFAQPNSPIANLAAAQLSDHNAIWARYRLL